MLILFEGMVNMVQNHWFWGSLTLLCLVWYSTITVYVAFKGVKDIKSMLKRLEENRRKSQS
jgi:hypothetical protein